MKAKRYSKYFSSIFLFIDIVFLNIGFFIANYIRFSQFWFQEDRYPFLYIFLNIAWIIIYFLARINRIDRESSIIDYVSQVLLALTINIAVVFTMWASTRAYFYSREHLFYTYLIFSISIISWRILFIYFIRYYRSKGFNTRNVIIVGYGPIGKNLELLFKEKTNLGYVFMGYFDRQTGPDKVVGDIDSIPGYCRNNNIDIIFCCLPRLYERDIKSIIDFSENNLVRVKMLTKLSSISHKDLSIQKYGGIPIVNVSSIPLDRLRNRIVKRAFDLLFSSLVILLILSWLIPILAILIRIDSKGPIFFKQKRTGINGKSFYCLKLRSMKVNVDSDRLQASRNDKRITKLGKLLRSSSLDELPQFFNVFLGEMSVVGPRPHMLAHTEEFAKKVDRFMMRHFIKPGITGLAQAKGYRGETSRFSEMYGRVKLDRFYVRNWNFLLDIKIIFLTVFSIVWKNEKAY